MPLRILVTGFEPFQGAQRNPSGDTASALDKEKLKGGGVVTGVVLPVLWDGSAKALDKAIASARPHIVVSLGMAEETFRVEQIADDRRIAVADNDQVTPKPRPATKRLPTNLPIPEVEKAITSVRPARVSPSKDAGGFLCNEVFYTLMKGYPKLLRSGFIHTPNDTFVPSKIKQAQVEDAIRAALVAIVADLSAAELKSAG